MRVSLTVFVLVTVLLIVCNPTLALGTRIATDARSLAPRPHFFLATHDFQHIDLYAIMEQARVWKQTTGLRTSVVVADYPHNHLLMAQTKLRQKEVDFVFVRPGTVSRVVDLLQTQHVCMFLYRHTARTGAFYMIRDSSPTPVVLVRIRSKTAAPCVGNAAYPCLDRTTGHSFVVQCSPDLRSRLDVTSPDNLLATLHRNLYTVPQNESTRCSRSTGR